MAECLSAGRTAFRNYRTNHRHVRLCTGAAGGSTTPRTVGRPPETGTRRTTDASSSGSALSSFQRRKPSRALARRHTVLSGTRSIKQRRMERTSKNWAALLWLHNKYISLQARGNPDIVVAGTAKAAWEVKSTIGPRARVQSVARGNLSDSAGSADLSCSRTEQRGACSDRGRSRSTAMTRRVTCPGTSKSAPVGRRGEPRGPSDPCAEAERARN